MPFIRSVFRFDMRQSMILSERYIETLLGDLRNTLLLLVQAPFLAGIIVLVWREAEHATTTLDFVMTLTCVWFGCVNACREIVKERPYFIRERRAGLSSISYIVSKATVLSLLGFFQSLLLTVLVNIWIPLRAPLPIYFAVLFLTSLAGTALGLLLSSISGSVDKAVGFVPLLLIPQILFSEFVLPEKYQSAVTKVMEKFMIVHWGYNSLKAAGAATIDAGVLAGNMSALVAFFLVLLVLTGLFVVHEK